MDKLKGNRELLSLGIANTGKFDIKRIQHRKRSRKNEISENESSQDMLYLTQEKKLQSGGNDKQQKRKISYSIQCKQEAQFKKEAKENKETTQKVEIDIHQIFKDCKDISQANPRKAVNKLVTQLKKQYDREQRCFGEAQLQQLQENKAMTQIIQHDDVVQGVVRTALTYSEHKEQKNSASFNKQQDKSTKEHPGKDRLDTQLQVSNPQDTLDIQNDVGKQSHCMAVDKIVVQLHTDQAYQSIQVELEQQRQGHIHQQKGEKSMKVTVASYNFLKKCRTSSSYQATKTEQVEPVPTYIFWRRLVTNELATDNGKRLYFTDDTGETVPASDDEDQREMRQRQYYSWQNRYGPREQRIVQEVIKVLGQDDKYISLLAERFSTQPNVVQEKLISSQVKSPIQKDTDWLNSSLQPQFELYCRRCSKFGCTLHGRESNAIKNQKPAPQIINIDIDQSCGEQCFKLIAKEPVMEQDILFKYRKVSQLLTIPDIKKEFFCYGQSSSPIQQNHTSSKQRVEAKVLVKEEKTDMSSRYIHKHLHCKSTLVQGGKQSIQCKQEQTQGLEPIQDQEQCTQQEGFLSEVKMEGDKEVEVFENKVETKNRKPKSRGKGRPRKYHPKDAQQQDMTTPNKRNMKGQSKKMLKEVKQSGKQSKKFKNRQVKVKKDAVSKNKKVLASMKRTLSPKSSNKRLPMVQQVLTDLIKKSRGQRQKQQQTKLKDYEINEEERLQNGLRMEDKQPLNSKKGSRLSFKRKQIIKPTQSHKLSIPSNIGNYIGEHRQGGSLKTDFDQLTNQTTVAQNDLTDDSKVIYKEVKKQSLSLKKQRQLNDIQSSPPNQALLQQDDLNTLNHKKVIVDAKSTLSIQDEMSISPERDRTKKRMGERIHNLNNVIGVDEQENTPEGIETAPGFRPFKKRLGTQMDEQQLKEEQVNFLQVQAKRKDFYKHLQDHNYKKFCETFLLRDIKQSQAVSPHISKGQSSTKSESSGMFFNPFLVKKAGRKSVKQTQELNKQKLKPWDTSQIQMLVNSVQIFGLDPCKIANFLGRKTCFEVYTFLQERFGPHIESLNCTNLQKRKGKGRPKNGQTKKFGTYNVAFSRLGHDINQPYNEYQPCTCIICGPDCPCVKSKNFCEKFCACSSKCNNKFKGCQCKSQCRTATCPCLAAGRECDPDLCNCRIPPLFGTTCHNHTHQDSCQNMKLRLRQHRRVAMGLSNIQGWGAYILEDVKKVDFVGEYTGDLITQYEADRRGKVYDQEDSSYLFNLNIQWVLDARQRGNKLRFANHSLNPNCFARILLVDGNHRVGIFASRDIQRGEEIFYDYRYEEDLAPTWAERPPNKQLKQIQYESEYDHGMQDEESDLDDSRINKKIRKF